jgi:tRNA threonylcarbamoyl adenosine modification protein YeaZ
MIRVALETSTSVGSVAVGRGGQVLAEVLLGVQTRHAEAVVPALGLVLKQAGVARSEVQEVVVGAGPGSFTGVRVAAATAKGLVAALDCPLLAYSSLLALVAGIPAAGPVCAMFDARRGEVYAGCWEVGTDVIREVCPPAVGAVADLVSGPSRRGGGHEGWCRGIAGNAEREADGQGIPASCRPLFVGDGALRYRSQLLEAGVPAYRIAAVPAYPRASALLWLAEHHRSGAEVRHVHGWEPTYMRGSSAERGVRG